MPKQPGLSYYSQCLKVCFIGLVGMFFHQSIVAQNMELDVSYTYINQKDWDPNDDNLVVMGEAVQINLNVANVRSGARLAYKWDFGNADIRDFGVGTPVEDKAFGNFSDCNRDYEFTVTVQDTVSFINSQNQIEDRLDVVEKTFTVTVYRRPNPVLSDVRNGNNARDQFSNCAAFNIENPSFEIEAEIISNDNCIASEVYSIDWGDGSAILTGVVPGGQALIHTYTEANAYNLTVDVQGSNGLMGRRIYVVKNQANPAIKPLFPGNTKGCGILDLEFGITMDETVLNSPNTIYRWDFDDGSDELIWTLDSLIANDGKITHRFDETTYYFDENGGLAKRHNFQVVAENSCDASTAPYYEIVIGGGPESYFTIEDSINCVDEPTVIIDQTLIGIFERDERENTQYWDFGDGSAVFTRIVSTPQDLTPIEHIYTAPGVYVVTLTTDSYCKPDDEKNVYSDTVIVVDDPVAQIQLLPSAGSCGNRTVSVVNNSVNHKIGAGNGSYWTIQSNDITASWSFTSGDKWSLEPAFELNGGGRYIIGYMAKNECDSMLFTDTIIVMDKPEVFGEFPKQACVGYPFETTDLEIATNYDPNTTVVWRASDPSISFDDTTTLYPTILFNALGEYQIELEVVNNCGRVDTSFFVQVFNVPPAPEFELVDSLGCGPFLLQIKVDSLKFQPFTLQDVNFTWLIGEDSISGQVLPPDSIWLQAGLNDTVYEVSFVVQSQCFLDTLTIPVTVFSPPTSRFEMMHQWECSPVQVNFKNLSEGSPDAYFWDFGDGNSSVKKNPSSLFVTDTLTRNFAITLVTENSCGMDTLQRNLLIRPQTVRAHFRMEPQLVCVGEPVRFQNFSTDTSSFIRTNFWEFGDGNVDTARMETTHAYKAPGKYYVKLTVNNYCGIDTLIDSIFVEPTPEIQILSPDTVCADVPVTFSLNSDVRIGAYNWNFGDTDSSRLTAPEHIFLTEGDHVVNVNVISSIGIGACSTSAQKTITIHPSPNDRIFPQDTSFCSPFLYTPKAVGVGGYHLWNFGVDSVVTSDPVKVYENRTGKIKKYTVTLTTENNFGCMHQEEATVSVLPQPRAGIDSAVIGESPRQLHLFNITQNAVNCVWIYENGDSIFTCADQVRYFSENGNYTIKLVTTNQYGCVDADSIMYEPGLNSGLFFPNAFAPNLDDQNARTFQAYGIGVREYELKVYDRWNNVVWSTNELSDSKPSGAWDGNDKTGNPLPHGVYYWVCRAKMYGKENEPYDNYNGTVYLIR